MLHALFSRFYTKNRLCDDFHPTPACSFCISLCSISFSHILTPLPLTKAHFSTHNLPCQRNKFNSIEPPIIPANQRHRAKPTILHAQKSVIELAFTSSPAPLIVGTNSTTELNPVLTLIEKIFHAAYTPQAVSLYLLY